MSKKKNDTVDGGSAVVSNDITTLLTGAVGEGVTIVTGYDPTKVAEVPAMTIVDDRHMIVAARDNDELATLTGQAVTALAEGYNVSPSPVYGNTEAVGRVWQNLVVTTKR